MIDELERKVVRAMNKNARKSFPGNRPGGGELGDGRHSCRQENGAGRSAEKAMFLLSIPPISDINWARLLSEIRISQGKLLEIQQKISEDPRVMGGLRVFLAIGIPSSSAISRIEKISINSSNSSFP